VTAAAVELEKTVRARTPAQDAESVAAMTKYGLQVIKLDPKAEGEFRSAATELVKTMRGGMVPADIYDAAVQERDASGRRNAGEGRDRVSLIVSIRTLAVEAENRSRSFALAGIMAAAARRDRRA
jgi:hypothetical protein